MSFDTKTVELHEDDMALVGDEGFDWSEAQSIAAVKLAFDMTDLGPPSNSKNFDCRATSRLWPFPDINAALSGAG